MECKYKRSRPYGVAIYELIETLWNVNLTAPQITADSARQELIETLWNVNDGNKKSIQR